MTTANDPPPPKRSDTKNPYAVLSPERVRQTAAHVQITERSEEETGSSQPAAPLDPSIPPEALRKPFASLVPNRPVKTSDAEAKEGMPPPAPSELFRQTASLRPPVTPRSSTSPRRPDATPSSGPNTCKVHGTVLTSSGVCVLCKREAERSKARRARQLTFWIVGLLLLCGAAAAAYLTRS